MQEHYIDTIFYQIELTAKYCKMLGQQVFDEYKTSITLEEYTILDTLMINKDLCQRDLAKLILKDRANTGKLLDALEGKGLITRELAMKKNRPVKIISVTSEGIAKAEEVATKIRPHYAKVKETINNSDLATVGDLLKKLRMVLNDTVDTQI